MHMCRQLVLGKGESHLTDKETEDQATEWLALVTPSLRGQASSSPTYLFQSLASHQQEKQPALIIPFPYRAWL